MAVRPFFLIFVPDNKNFDLMRRFLLFLLCCMSASAVLAQSYKLVINKTDGQTLELNTSDVKEIQVVVADGMCSLTVSDLTDSGCI